MSFSEGTNELDMRTVSALAKVVATGFHRTVARQQAEYEILACLPRSELVIDDERLVPLNFGCRQTPPVLHISLEDRGPLIGFCLELMIDAFLATRHGD